MGKGFIKYNPKNAFTNTNFSLKFSDFQKGKLKKERKCKLCFKYIFSFRRKRIKRAGIKDKCEK